MWPLGKEKPLSCTSQTTLGLGRLKKVFKTRFAIASNSIKDTMKRHSLLFFKKKYAKKRKAIRKYTFPKLVINLKKEEHGN